MRWRSVGRRPETWLSMAVLGGNWSLLLQIEQLCLPSMAFLIIMEGLKIQDIMGELDCSQRFVERLIAEGRLKSEKIKGAHCIKPEDFKAFKEEEEAVNRGKKKRLIGKTLFGKRGIKTHWCEWWLAQYEVPEAATLLL